MKLMNWKFTLISTLFIALLLFLSPAHLNLLSTVQAAVEKEQVPQIRLVPSATHVQVGETVEVAIWLQGFIGDHSDVEGYEIHIHFDPKLLQPVTDQTTVTPTIFPAKSQVLTLINSVDAKGTIKIGQALTQRNGLFSGYGKVGVITFQAEKAGEATLTQAKSIIIKPQNPGLNIIHKVNQPTITIGGQAPNQKTGKADKQESVGSKPKHVGTPLTADQLLQSFTDYRDIAHLNWSTEAIAKLAQNKVIQGSAQGSFEPRRQMTRAEFAKVAVIALGLDMKQQQTPSFADINKTDWYYDYVETAVQYGLIQGSTQNDQKVFLPHSTITRAEISTILSRALTQVKGYDLGSSRPTLNPFQDIQESHWAKQNIDLLTTHGLMKGRSDTHFAPNEHATRAEVSVLLIRLLEFKP